MLENLIQFIKSKKDYLIIGIILIVLILLIYFLFFKKKKNNIYINKVKIIKPREITDEEKAQAIPIKIPSIGISLDNSRK